MLERAGARLRYAWWNARASAPRGTVVILPGRGEFIEKYATEVVGDLLERGFAVAALDWRGQGLSDRPLPDRGKGHIDTFATYMADVRLFLETVVSPDAPRPVLALCHSMGSHIMMREMAENGTGPFSAALFVAPANNCKPGQVSCRFAQLGFEVMSGLWTRQQNGGLTTVLADREVWRRLAA